jgi:hypothetical protein
VSTAIATATATLRQQLRSSSESQTPLNWVAGATKPAHRLLQYIQDSPVGLRDGTVPRIAALRVRTSALAFGKRSGKSSRRLYGKPNSDVICPHTRVKEGKSKRKVQRAILGSSIEDKVSNDQVSCRGELAVLRPRKTALDSL